MIKTIGFDLGGVIFPDLHIPVEGKIAKKLGISSEVAGEIFDEVWVKLSVGQTTEDELWKRLAERSKKKN